MRVNRGLLGWGVFFIVLGAVPLAVRAGAIDESAVTRAWELWPLVLVGIGLGLALGRTHFAFVGNIVVGATLGLMGGALIATGIGSVAGFSACGGSSGSGGSAFETRTGSFSGDARVTLAMNCGEVRVGSADGAGWQVSGTSDGGRAPEISTGDTRLDVKATGVTGFWPMTRPWSWDVTLPRQVGVSVGLEVNAGSGRLDLGQMRVPDLAVTVNAGDARVDLGGATGSQRFSGTANAGSLAIALPAPEGTLTGSLSVNAGSAKVCVPQGTAMRFRVNSETLSSTNLGGQGLLRTGDTYTTPGFDTAASRIDVGLTVNLGSITLNPEDGCE